MKRETVRGLCLNLANEAADLAIAELVKTDGHQIAQRLSDGELLTDILRGSCDRNKSPAKYVRRRWIGEGSPYNFKEESRDRKVRMGKIRPTDLVIRGHFSSERFECFVVVDVRGDLFGGLYHLPPDGTPTRFEAWCRLYRCEDPRKWEVHYVDVIVPYLKPAQRRIYKLERIDRSNPLVAKEVDARELCLFFESPQGGTFG